MVFLAVQIFCQKGEKSVCLDIKEGCMSEIQGGMEVQRSLKSQGSTIERLRWCITMLQGAHDRAMLTEAMHGLTHDRALELCLLPGIQEDPSNCQSYLFLQTFWGGGLLLFRKFIRAKLGFILYSFRDLLTSNLRV